MWSIEFETVHQDPLCHWWDNRLLPLTDKLCVFSVLHRCSHLPASMFPFRVTPVVCVGPWMQEAENPLTAQSFSSEDGWCWHCLHHHCPEQTCTQGLSSEPLYSSVESEKIKGRSQLEFVRWHASPSPYPSSFTALFFCMEHNETWRFHALRTDNRVKRTFPFAERLRRLVFPSAA